MANIFNNAEEALYYVYIIGDYAGVTSRSVGLRAQEHKRNKGLDRELCQVVRAFPSKEKARAYERMLHDQGYKGKDGNHGNSYSWTEEQKQRLSNACLLYTSPSPRDS